MQFETLIGESGKANQKFLFRSENSYRCRKNGSFVGCDLSSESLGYVEVILILLEH